MFIEEKKLIKSWKIYFITKLSKYVKNLRAFRNESKHRNSAQTIFNIGKW